MNFKNATRSAIEAMSAEEVKLWVLECIADNAKKSAPKVKEELDFTQFVSTDKLRPTINYVYEQVGKFRCATDTHILLYEYLGEDIKLAKSDMRSSSEPIRLYDKKNKMVYEGTIDDLNLARKNEEYYEFWTKFPDAPCSFGIYPNVHQVIDYPSNMYKEVIEIDLDEYEDGLTEVEELNKETLAEKKEYKKKAKLGLLKDNEYGIVFRDILDDALFFVGVLND